MSYISSIQPVRAQVLPHIIFGRSRNNLCRSYNIIIIIHPALGVAADVGRDGSRASSVFAVSLKINRRRSLGELNCPGRRVKGRAQRVVRATGKSRGAYVALPPSHNLPPLHPVRFITTSPCNCYPNPTFTTSCVVVGPSPFLSEFHFRI